MQRALIGFVSAALLIGMLPEWRALALSADEPAKASSATKPPWQRLLQGEDAKKAAELEKQSYQLQEAGKFEEGLALGAPLLAEAQAAQYAPLRAQVQYLMGRLRQESGEYDEAATLLREAAASAAED